MKSTDRQVISGGKLLRAGEGREIAAYLRDGCVWVAEFNAGRGEVHLASEWFVNRRRAVRLYEVNLDAIGGISDELLARIEGLHDAKARRSVGQDGFASAVRFIAAGVSAVLARLRPAPAQRSAVRGAAEMAG